MTVTPRRYYGRNPAEKVGDRISRVPEHKFKVGQQVRYVRMPTDRVSREMEKSLFAAPFEVSRLMPSAGTEFQYRLKNLATGQERIAGEAELFLVESA